MIFYAICECFVLQSCYYDLAAEVKLFDGTKTDVKVTVDLECCFAALVVWIHRLFQCRVQGVRLVTNDLPALWWFCQVGNMKESQWDFPNCKPQTCTTAPRAPWPWGVLTGSSPLFELLPLKYSSSGLWTRGCNFISQSWVALFIDLLQLDA